jgi:hypothetical protein
LYRNSSDCPHCGRRFARCTEMTPIVNRSDGRTFHVSLYSGPNPRPRFSGGFYLEQLICGFGYAFDQIGAKTNGHCTIETENNEVPEFANKLAKLHCGKKFIVIDLQKIERQEWTVQLKEELIGR